MNVYITTLGGVYLKKMKILAYCLTAIALLLIISHSASAGYAKYYPSENIIQVYSEPNGVNFTWLDSQINNQSLLFNDGDIWYLNATLSLYQSKFYINNTDVSKLILGSAPNYGKLSFGHPFYINNVEITGGYEIGASGAFHDLYIHDAGGIRLDGIRENVYNITVMNSTSGLNFRNSNDIKIYNVSVTNTKKTAVSCYNCDNTEVYDVFVENAGNYSNPSTGCFAMIYWGGSEYSSAHDIFVNGTAWSSIEATDPATHDILFYNITVYNSGHNGLDLHGGSNYTVNNMTVHDSVSNNILSVGSTNVTLTNITSYKTGTDRGIYVAKNNDNFTLINYYSENAGEAFTGAYSDGMKIINMTSKNCAYGAQLTSLDKIPVRNISIIDSNFIDSRRNDLWIYAARNSRFINVNYTTTLYGNSDVESVFYYYTDIIAKNNLGTLVPNARISITNSLEVNAQSVDAYGENKSIFQTNQNGQTYLPDEDRKNSPAIAEKYINSAVIYNNLSHTATITTPDNHAVSLSGITPYSSWYRPDPNIPTYTITAIIPDNSAGPHLIGFAPAEDNPFNPGEKKNFRVWTDEHLSTMEWYVDGSESPVHKGSLNYTWPVTEGNHIIKFVGSNANGTVNKTWQLGESSGDASVIAIAPEYQVVTPKQSFNLDITVDPSIPIAGTQLDFKFNSSRASANSVTEGNLFKQNGAKTHFGSGTIDNNAGKIKNIYSSIIGTSDISTPGTMATVNLTAGNRTGMAEFNILNVLISDINSKSVSGTVKNATVLIDTAPVIDPIYYPESVSEKTPVTFKVSAKDADGDRLTFSASALPEGASFNKTSGDFAWTPAEGQAGVYTMTFKVSDGYLTDSKDVTITVNTNKPPVINYFEPLNGSSFSEGERINILVNASDEDGQVLNYIIKIDGVTHSTDPEYVWETDYSSSGNHAIEASVSDGIDEVKRQHTIYISECHPRWDVNEDGIVNILDIITVSQKYGTTVSKPYPRYDVNQDGLVNDQDLNLVRNHFGEIVN